MAGRARKRAGVAAFAAVALGLSAAGALADDAAGAIKHDAASNSRVIGAGSGSGGGSPNTVVDPANGGVAGTGMGKTEPMAGSKASGTGQSVSGPAGQGITHDPEMNK